MDLWQKQSSLLSHCECLLSGLLEEYATPDVCGVQEESDVRIQA